METQTAEITRPNYPNEFKFLDALRKSGSTNMFGAGAYLESAFHLKRRDARKILAAWMSSFGE